MNDGWLDAHVHIQMPSGQRLLVVDGLKKTLQGLCQWRVDSVFLRRQYRSGSGRMDNYYCHSFLVIDGVVEEADNIYQLLPLLYLAYFRAGRLLSLTFYFLLNLLRD